jgi:hypothetical protein
MPNLIVKLLQLRARHGAAAAACESSSGVLNLRHLRASEHCILELAQALCRREARAAAAATGSRSTWFSRAFRPMELEAFSRSLGAGVT